MQADGSLPRNLGSNIQLSMSTSERHLGLCLSFSRLVAAEHLVSCSVVSAGQSLNRADKGDTTSNRAAFNSDANDIFQTSEARS